MQSTANKTVGEIVADDYRTAAIFEKYGIDFCCKGNKSIDDACETKHIDPESVKRELSALPASEGCSFIDYRAWPASMLADHIESKHHSYVEEKLPVILRYLDKVTSVHGPKHPELYEVARLFRESAAELTAHMKKEELILFPRIRKLTMQERGTVEKNALPPIRVKSPIAVMLQEHETEGDRFELIEKLTDHYTVPPDACNTFKVTYALLREFENDLHLHIHLENNLLFPKAIEMEERMMN